MDIKRIVPSKRDFLALEKLKATRPWLKKSDLQNYRNCVVLKPWGFEYLIYENEAVAIWFLKIGDRHGTSMHCHPLKKTSLVLLKGQALCNTFQQRNYLTAPAAVIIEKGVFHSTKALSPGGIEMIEIESPPNKMDLVRLSDTYGREDLGYEGITEMERSDLGRFNHFYFDEPTKKEGPVYYREDYCLSIESFPDHNDLINSPFPEEKSLYTLCRGQLRNDRDELLLDVGETQSGNVLKRESVFHTSGKTLFLKIQPKGYENHAN